MKRIENIIIHCSDSLWGCAREITQWHIQRGFKSIGYHFVILNATPTFAHMKNAHLVPALDGSIECGLYLDEAEVGAHATGYNERAIGICLIGIDEFSTKQIDALRRLVADLMVVYRIPIEKILGCPNLDMKKFRADLSAWKKVVGV